MSPSGHRGWVNVEERYPPGTIVRGRIKQVMSFGAAIEVHNEGMPGEPLRGIVRNAEISWDRKVTDARKELSEGSEVHAVVMKVDVEHSRLILSLRRVEHDPWNELKEKCQPGAVTHGVVAHLLGDVALINLTDGMNGITARMPIDEIVPWRIEHPSEVLEVGDRVEAIVVSKDVGNREIFLSLKQRIEKLEEEIGSPAQQGQPGTPAVTTAPQQAATQTSPHHVMIKTVLVADDMRDERDSLAALLRESGLQVDVASTKDEAVDMFLDQGYDLALLDIRMPSHLEGIDAAQEILEDVSGAKVVLFTGSTTWDESMDAVRERQLDIAGMLLKPIDPGELFATIREIEETGHAAMPESPSSNSLSFVRGMAVARTKYDRTLEEILEQSLQDLSDLTSARAAAIFSMDPLTYNTDMLAAHEIPVENFLAIQHKLRYSPVRDVLLDQEHIFALDIDRVRGKFRYLLPITELPDLKFRMLSCIAVPIHAAGTLAYGLFLFHLRRNAFDESARDEAERAAVLIGAVMGERIISRDSSVGRRFELLGQLASSLGHELRGQLTALAARLDILDARIRQTESAIRQGQTTSHLALLREALDWLERMKNNMMALVRSFMNITMSEQIASVRIREVLESAIRAVSDEANKAKVEIITDFSSGSLDLEIKSVPVMLQQVFVNVLLNAVQHMHTSKREKGRVYVTVRLIQNDDQPIKVRFRDTGPGIHAEIEDLIFEPMFSTKQTETEEGTGMGLAICRSLLSAMGGRISLEDTAIMMGSTFLVELPLEMT